MSIPDYRVDIAYDHGESGESYVYTGAYVPNDELPFDLTECAGVRFDIDGVQCELLGDLGGHAVYRRVGQSKIYTMDWESFSHAVDEIVEIGD